MAHLDCVWQHFFDSDILAFQLYEIDDNPKRKEFLDELFRFMQNRGKTYEALSL